MNLDIKFLESNKTFDLHLEENINSFTPLFGNTVVVERVDIPKQYGLVTYDQNKTITVS